MKFDTYTLKGRVIPAFFSIILPVIIFNHFYVSEEFSKFVGDLIGAKIVSNITISVVLLYVLSEAGRFLGKNIFERIYFKDEENMPSTNYLLFSNVHFTKEHKSKIRERIKKDFDIELLSEQDESLDEITARKRIVESMSLVRNKLHSNTFLFQHNVEYGAMRNIIGGSLIGLILSLLNMYFFTQVVETSLAATVSYITASIYFIFILFSKPIINFYGQNYAKILYREYLSSSS